jgi:hypothetical protein
LARILGLSGYLIGGAMILLTTMIWYQVLRHRIKDAFLILLGTACLLSSLKVLWLHDSTFLRVAFWVVLGAALIFRWRQSRKEVSN